MKKRDWEKLQTSAHIQNIMKCYSKIKNGFSNEKNLNVLPDNIFMIYGIDRIKKELLQLKVKLEKYKKISGL